MRFGSLFAGICGKHEGNCEVIITCRDGSDLAGCRIGDGILVQPQMRAMTVLKVTGTYELPGLFRELHCEVAKPT